MELPRVFPECIAELAALLQSGDELLRLPSGHEPTLGMAMIYKLSQDKSAISFATGPKTLKIPVMTSSTQRDRTHPVLGKNVKERQERKTFLQVWLGSDYSLGL